MLLRYTERQLNGLLADRFVSENLSKIKVIRKKISIDNNEIQRS